MNWRNIRVSKSCQKYLRELVFASCSFISCCIVIFLLWLFFSTRVLGWFRFPVEITLGFAAVITIAIRFIFGLPRLKFIGIVTVTTMIIGVFVFYLLVLFSL